jgi:Tol biopolymer transport system component
VWDAATGQEVLTLKGHDVLINSLCFSPDGKHILTASSWQHPDASIKSADYTLRVYDAETGEEVLAVQGHRGGVNSVAFSPDGKRLVTGMRSDLTAKVWDVATGRQVLSLKGHMGPVGWVAFAPDGKRIVTGSADRTARVWDAATGKEIVSFKGHSNFVNGVCFSPDGKRIASASHDRTVKVWGAADGREVLSLTAPAGPVYGVAFSPDGKRIFGWDGQMKVLAWSAEDGKPTPPDNPPVAPLGFADSRRGSRVVLMNGIIAVIDVAMHARQNAWPLPDAAERRRYHTEQATVAEQEKRWFAVAFHLGRLLLDAPADAELKRRRNEALRSQAAAVIPNAPPRMDRVP